MQYHQSYYDRNAIAARYSTMTHPIAGAPIDGVRKLSQPFWTIGSSLLGNSEGNYSLIQTLVLSFLPLRDLVSARTCCRGIESVGKESRQDIITQFSALNFADRKIVLARLQKMLLEHPMHQSQVKTRPPTKEEISRAPKIARLLHNRELFMIGTPFDVYFEQHGEEQAFYNGKVNFSLFGLPGKRTTAPSSIVRLSLSCMNRSMA